MTTKFLDDKICTFKFSLSWRLPRKKKSVLDDFPLHPQFFTSLRTAHLVFIVVSPSLKNHREDLRR